MFKTNLVKKCLDDRDEFDDIGFFFLQRLTEARKPIRPDVPHPLITITPFSS